MPRVQIWKWTLRQLSLKAIEHPYIALLNNCKVKHATQCTGACSLTLSTSVYTLCPSEKVNYQGFCLFVCFNSIFKVIQPINSIWKSRRILLVLIDTFDYVWNTAWSFFESSIPFHLNWRKVALHVHLCHENVYVSVHVCAHVEARRQLWLSPSILLPLFCFIFKTLNLEFTGSISVCEQASEVLPPSPKHMHTAKPGICWVTEYSARVHTQTHTTLHNYFVTYQLPWLWKEHYSLRSLKDFSLKNHRNLNACVYPAC